MPLDIGKLTPTELIRLVNSTPLGPVLSPTKVNRQMNQGGYRIGDGRRIHLAKYVSWLARGLDKPKASKQSVADARAAELAAKNAARRDAQDIGPLPEVEDPDRRRRACEDFKFFCETYFPDVFYLPWSDDHLRVIEKIEIAVTQGGLYGTKRTSHALFAEHIAGSETSVLTNGHGRDVREWRLKPLRPDNHWLDCLVGCAVAASIQGVTLGGVHQPIEAPPRQKRVSLAEIQRRKR